MSVGSDFDDMVKICEFYAGSADDVVVDLDSYFQSVLPDWREDL